MTRKKPYNNQVLTNNKISVEKQYHVNNSNRRYPSKKPFVDKNKEANSQKRQSNYSDIGASNTDCQTLKFVSKNITSNKTSEKHAFNKRSPVNQTKNANNIFEKPLKTEKNKDESNLNVSMDNLNNSKSNLLETKLKKFEAQCSTLGDLHFPTKDYSTPRSVTSMYCGRGNKSNRKNFSNKM